MTEREKMLAGELYDYGDPANIFSLSVTDTSIEYIVIELYIRIGVTIQ